MNFTKNYMNLWLQERINHYEGVDFDLTKRAFERGIEIGEVRGTLDALYQMRDLLKKEE